MFTRSFLFGLRRKALRRGVWYKSLDHLDQGIFCLVTRVVDRVESEVLAVVLVKIVKRLRDAMKSDFVRRMEVFGFERAVVVAARAVAWGYRAAKSWTSDLGFVRYLACLELYKSIL